MSTKKVKDGTRRKLVVENGTTYTEEVTTSLVATYKIKKTDIERAKQMKRDHPHLPGTVEDIATVLSLLEKENVLNEPLVDEIVSKSPHSNDDERSFELTEKVFRRCEKLLSAMMPLNWEVTFTSQKKRRPGVM